MFTYSTPDATAVNATAFAVRASVERGDPFAGRSMGDVLASVESREAEVTAVLATSAARADEAVADDAHCPDAQFGVVASDSNRDDPAGMEHARQSRLSRWQRLPT